MVPSIFTFRPLIFQTCDTDNHSGSLAHGVIIGAVFCADAFASVRQDRRHFRK
jgi:hypothetical protein